MTASEAEQAAGLDPDSNGLVGHSSFAQEPAWFTTSPVSAIKNLHEQLGWSPDNVDLYEVNEAFAVVTMAAMQDVGLDHARSTSTVAPARLGIPLARRVHE